MSKNILNLCVVGILGLSSFGVSQELYGTWSKYREITVNTTSSGANIATTQLNVPVLVRLNSANFTFAGAAGNGRDVRFSKTNTLPLKYQIESWDSAGQSASVWVLLDTVFGNSNTANLRVYYGKAGAADSSNGAAVFSTANNFQGVFHLNEATNDTARDATANKFKGIPRNRGGSNPQNVAGLIGNAKNFLGDTLTNNGGAYRLATSTGGNTWTNNALNFQNDSSTVNGQQLYTISFWMNATQFPNGTTTRKGIISKSRGTNGSQYHFVLLDPAIDQINHPKGDTQRVSFADGPAAVYKRGDHKLTPYVDVSNNFFASQWHHVAAIRTGAVGTPANLRLIVDGAFACSSSTSLTQTTRSDFDVTIGGYSNDSGFFSGKIDEVEFSNINRSDDWIKLAYETQKPTATAVVVSGTDFTPPPPPTTTFPILTLVLKTGTAMTPDTPVTTGQVSAFAVTAGTLPAGLTLNQTTGIISGTPTVAQAAANVTITAAGPGGSATVVLSITVNAPPAITNQPVAGTITVGNAAVAKFGVVATGTAPRTYKWIRTRGVTIDTVSTGIFSRNVAGDTLTVTGTGAAVTDSGQIKCLVTNVAGSVVSNSVRLTVNPLVGILGPYVVHVKGLNQFSFRIPDNGINTVRMSAEDMTGRVVWDKDISLAKSRVVSWNGSGHDGRAVSSGMYVVRMKLLGDGKATESIQTGIKN